MKLAILTFLSSAAVLPSQAAVVYSGIKNIAIPFNFEGVYLNVSTGVSSNALPGDATTSPTINFLFGGTAINNEGLLLPAVDGAGNVVSITVGSTIGGSLAYAASPSGSIDHVGTDPGQFIPAVAGYMGMSFRITGTEPLPYYGWIKFTPSNSGGAVIESWGYESVAGQPITAGAVPEPSAVMVFGGFAFASLAVRRRSR